MAKRPVSEQVLVITGASSGVGRATARAAGRRGAKVVLAARNREALENAAREVEDAGGEALVVAADVSSRVENETIVERAVERFGRIDSYVACAMVTVYAEVEQLEPDELARVMDVNFAGRVHGFQAVLPHLKASGGTFVDFNSALAYRGIPLQAAYCASKAALRTFLESARVEQRKHRTGVDVVVLLPGAINTPQFDRARQKLGRQPMPVPPIYEPEPYAEAILAVCERPERELPVTWGAQRMLWGQKASPSLGDLVLLRIGWKRQTTGEPKPVASPDNLFETMAGDPGARGRFGDRARPSTPFSELRLKLGKTGSAALLASALAALFGYHSLTRRD